MRVPRPFQRYARRYPPQAVTSLEGSREGDPREAGLTREAVDAIWASAVRLYDSGLHPALTLCVRRNGKVVLDRAIGHVRGNSPDDPPGTPLVQATPRTLFNLYSASKCVTAMLVHMLQEQRLLDIDKPVAEYIPEFGKHGKDRVTVRHVLAHRAGVPNVPGVEISLEVAQDPKAVVDIICNAKPISKPGEKLAYHALTMGYIVGEIVSRVSGKDLRTLLHDQIQGPLGFEHLNFGVKPEEVPLVAENAFTGAPAFPPYSWMLERSLGISLADAVKLSNDPRFLTGVVPSANIITTANEASRYFQLLLDEGELDGTRIMERHTVRRAVQPQNRLEYDTFMNMPVRYGLGFMLGHRWISLYGHDTPRSYGHIGFTAVTVWADPERKVAAALMTSGKPFITPGQVLWINVARTVSRYCPKVA
jgi:CubicO group peptidase (beta-lactamase class C family)